MKILTCPMLAALALLAGTALAETTFTYQGKLGNAGAPAAGPHDFVFRLFDAETGGAQVGADVAVAAVDVTDGIFTVQLDFGEAPFNSSPRWLEIDVREAGSGAYTTLAPRNRIGASPFAVETLFVAPGAVDTAAIQDGAVTTDKIAERAVTRIRMANNAVDTAVITDRSITANDIYDSTITSEKFAEGAVDSRAIADGTITLDDLEADVVLSSKTELVRRTSAPVTVNAGSAEIVVSSCATNSGIPIAAACEVISSIHDMRVRSFEYSDWTNPSAPASVLCDFRNPGSSPRDVQAVIICLEAP